MQRYKQISLTALLFVVLVLSACGSTGIPRGITPVANFDLQRYLGKWYEIARLDHKFERGLQEVTATYALNEDGSVKVTNSGIKTKTGERDSAIGKAKFVGPSNVGHLKVSFFGPFYGSYIIYELDEVDYSYALIAGPNRDYMWILSRTPQMDIQQYNDLLAVAKQFGYNTDELIKVTQSD
jgi:apolipoprotein D and lipocalin family protein